MDNGKGPKDLQDAEHHPFADTVELPVIQRGCPAGTDQMLQEYICGQLPRDAASLVRAKVIKAGEVDAESGAETRLRVKIESSVDHVNSIYDLIDKTMCFQTSSIRMTNNVYRTTFDSLKATAVKNIRCRTLSQRVTKTILPLLKRLHSSYTGHERIAKAFASAIRNFESIEEDLKDLAVLG